MAQTHCCRRSSKEKMIYKMHESSDAQSLYEEITEISHSIDDIYNDANDENLLIANPGIGVMLDFRPRIFLLFSSSSFDGKKLDLTTDGDLKFELVGWRDESDGFTYSPILKVQTDETANFVRDLESTEGMPFWGYVRVPDRGICTGDRTLLNRFETDSLRKLFYLKRQYTPLWENP